MVIQILTGAGSDYTCHRNLKTILTAVVLLDFSAAFDSVDHPDSLLRRHQDWFEISGSELNWFANYLRPQPQSVYSYGNYSPNVVLTCDALQDAVLGPLLFTLYWIHHATSSTARQSFTGMSLLMTFQSIFYLTVTCLWGCCPLPLRRQSWMAANKLPLNPLLFSPYVL